MHYNILGAENRILFVLIRPQMDDIAMILKEEEAPWTNLEDFSTSKIKVNFGRKSSTDPCAHNLSQILNLLYV